MLCKQNNREIIKFTPEAMKSLSDYYWPGNVRELENEVKRLLTLSSNNLITSGDLSEAVTNDKIVDREKVSQLKEKVRELEVKMIKNALKETNGNQLQTAKLLGLSRHGLIKKIKRYGLEDCCKSARS